MSTPTTNSVPRTFINTALLGVGRYVGHGEKWGGGLGTGVTLTFSFPNLGYWSTSPAYGDGTKEYQSMYAMNSYEQAAAKSAMAVWSHFANINFVQTSDTQTNVGDIRFALSTKLPTGTAAWAYYPSTNPAGGDVWFNTKYFNLGRNAINAGDYDYLTILHELGHALGLKHTFSTPNAAPLSVDNYFYSIMAYTASPWSAHQKNYASFYPTTPMYYDLVAIEALYGQRSYNTGNNAYVFYDGVKYWQAINDTGGSDYIQYVGAENVTINLNPGTFSTLSEAIQFQKAGGGYVYSKATVTIGPNVWIESAVGGNGNDTLIGNNYGNGLYGQNGNDLLIGNFGNDYLSTGIGYDTVRFSTAPNSVTNHDTVSDYNPAYDTIQLENAVFTKIGNGTPFINPAFFRNAAHALDSNDYIVYNQATGNLFYDDNGYLAGHEILIATFTNKPVLNYLEFQII